MWPQCVRWIEQRAERDQGPLRIDRLVTPSPWYLNTALCIPRRTPPACSPGGCGGIPDASQRLPGPFPSVSVTYLGPQGSLSTIGNQKTPLNCIRQLKNCRFWALKRPPACLTLQHPRSAVWWGGLHLVGGGCYRRSPLSQKICSNYQFWPSGSDFSETRTGGWSRVIAGGRGTQLLATFIFFIYESRCIIPYSDCKIISKT